MRAAYGGYLRSFLTQDVYVQQIIDFGDLPVFPDVSAYPCIAITSKEDRDGRSTSYLRVPSLKFGSLDRFVEENATSLPAEAFQEENWQLTGAAEHRVLSKMEQVSVPLGRWLGDVEIHYGIKTGFNEAFFIDKATRDRLVSEDPKSAEIIKPLVVGDDIKRYEIEFKGQYLIWTYVGVPIEQYPAIFNHLKQYQSQLEARWDQGEQWWELRHCDYYEDFEKPKIMYQDISERGAFAYDAKGFFANNTVYFFNASNVYTLALLNSSLGEHYFRSQTTEYRGGYLRFFTQYIERTPIRRIFFTTPDEEREQQIEVLNELYQRRDFPKLLEAVEACLPNDENDEFLVFSRSLPVKQAIEKGFLTEEQAKEWALEPDDPCGYDEQGRPIERSDVVHDLLAYLAEQMIEMHKEKREIIERFWTDVEGVTEVEPFKKLRRGKRESTLAQREACRPFVNAGSGSTKTLEASLGWNEAAFREFAKLLAGRIGNLSELVEVYRRYAPDFKELMDKIETTDKLIDQIVYKLYGLTEEGATVVEEQRELRESVE